MNIVEITQEKIHQVPSTYHILTYAEDGFSPFDIYTKKSNLEYDTLKEYVKRSNEKDEIVTMHPLFNLSMIPRRFVREPVEPIEFYAKLLELFDLNASEIRAKKFIFDFRTPRIPLQVKLAIAMFGEKNGFADIEEILIVSD